VLKFDFVVPYSSFFLDIWVTKYEIDRRIALMAQFYSENALVSYQMRKYRPSLVAWACLCLAVDINFNCNEIFRSKIWEECPLGLQGLDVKACGYELLRVLKRSDVKNLAIYKKFCQDQYNGISRSNFWEI
jgi:hypothetical protein